MTVLEIQGRKVKVGAGFTELSLDEQKRTVDEIATKMGLTADSQGAGKPTGERDSFMSRVHSGIATGAGFPVDALNAATDYIPGYDAPERPFGGSESIKGGMESLGIDVSHTEAETLPEKFIEGASEVGGSLITGAPIIKLAAKGGGVLGAAAKTLGEALTKSPVISTLTELMAGGVGRVGGQVAIDATGGSENPWIRLGGELGGNVLGGMGPSAALRGGVRATSQVPVLGTALRAVPKALAPMTKAGAKYRAGDRMKNLVSDPSAVADTLNNPKSLGDLTPAQITNETGLLQLQNAAGETSPLLRDRLEARQSKSKELLGGELQTSGNVLDAQNFIAESRQALTKKFEGYLTVARQNAQTALDKITPAMRETDNSMIVRDEIKIAYDKSKLYEQSRWDAVPMKATVGTGNVTDVFKDIVVKTSRAQTDDIPSVAKSLLNDGFGEDESVREMHGLYSKLRQISREANSGVAPNKNKARLADRLSDAILKDLGAFDGDTTAVGFAVNEARAATAALKKTFGQGTVGKLTGKTRDGGAGVAPEVGLGATVGRGGAKGLTAVDDIRIAVGDKANPAMEDFLKGAFEKSAVRNGDVVPSSADRFNRQNKEIMEDSFPGLGKEFGAASNAQRTAATTEKRIDAITKSLNNPNKSVGASIVNAKRGEEIAQAVFKSKNPVKAMQELVRQTTKDKTGKAAEGLKGGVTDWLISQVSGGFDAKGIMDIKGNKLAGMMLNDENAKVLSQVFKPDELVRLNRISKEFQALNKTESVGALDSVIDDPVNSVISYVTRLKAAQIGANAAGNAPSLLTAHWASKGIEKIITKLTNNSAHKLLVRSIEDPELMQMLLRPMNGPIPKAIERRMIETLIGGAAIQLSGNQE